MAFQTDDWLMQRFYARNPDETRLARSKQPFRLLDSAITNRDSTDDYRRENYPFTVMELVLEGANTITVDDDSFTVRSGDLYILPRHSTHTITFPNPDKLCIKKYFVADGPLLDYLLQVHNLFGIHYFPQARTEEIESCFDQIRASFRAEPASPWQEKALLVHKLIVLLSKNLSTDSDMRQFALKVRYWIDRHLFERFELGKMCRDLGCSKSDLFRNCHKNFNTTPYQLHLKAKLEAARKVLRNSPTIKMKDIAERFGFSDCYHFSKIFKRHLGITPSEFRSGKEVPGEDPFSD